ncbi:unnamed protein product [Meloidogyne enterolobii]|uniref:Uncharacterized protein n=1 Tax=Meloidogyne enterolobii TaxID=390850 RepID=A0ACB1ARB5_MELEN
MCSRVNVVGVRILDNPSKPTDPFKLEITFELFENIKEEVEWELVFVATDGKEEHDQVLDSVVIGQVREGRHKFDFEAPAPQLQNLRPEDFMDVTLLLLKCKYRDQLFMKIGWFITHTYIVAELIENPPPRPIIEKLQRTVVTEDVRVTTYPIKWDEDLNNGTVAEDENEAMIDEDNDLDGINGDGENSIQQSQGDQVPPVGTDL